MRLNCAGALEEPRFSRFYRGYDFQHIVILHAPASALHYCNFLIQLHPSTFDQPRGVFVTPGRGRRASSATCRSPAEASRGGRQFGRAEQAKRAEVGRTGGGGARLPPNGESGAPGPTRRGTSRAGRRGFPAQRAAMGKGQSPDVGPGAPLSERRRQSVRREWGAPTEKPSDSEEGALPSPTFRPRMPRI